MVVELNEGNLNRRLGPGGGRKRPARAKEPGEKDEKTDRHTGQGLRAGPRTGEAERGEPSELLIEDPVKDG